jgi:hypothetical protein
MRKIVQFFLAVGLLAFTGMSRAQEPADQIERTAAG